MSHPIVFHIFFSSESLLPIQLKPPADSAGTDVWIAIGCIVWHQPAGPMKGLLTQTSRLSFHFLQRAFSPVIFPSQRRKCLPRIRCISYMEEYSTSKCSGESIRASSVLKEVEKWTTLETWAWHHCYAYKRFSFILLHEVTLNSLFS